MDDLEARRCAKARGLLGIHGYPRRRWTRWGNGIDRSGRTRGQGRLPEIGRHVSDKQVQRRQLKEISE